MASFSFGAGNAAKLLRIPYYAAGRLATLVIPRSRDGWVFGCGAGIGDGALALWEIASSRHRDAVWLVGSAREEADASARGIPTVRKHSLRGFWRTARARVVVITHGFGDVNRYAVQGAFVVQLWHGIPLKRIGIDSPETVRVPGPLRRTPLAGAARRLIAALYRTATRRIDVIPAASQLVRGRLESAFSLPQERVPVTGEPRVDVLSRGDADDRRTTARAALAAAVGPFDVSSRIVLYAPTWRDGAQDPAIPSAVDWTALTDILQREDALLLIRSHPLGAGEYRPPEASRRIRAIGSDLVSDITPLLSGVDVLVTDYSSLVFDSSLVPVPVVYLAPDVEDYARRRGFYGTYQDVAGPDWARDWATAARQLREVLADPSERERRLQSARTVSALVHDFDDGMNTHRVYRAILSGLGRTRRDVGPEGVS